MAKRRFAGRNHRRSRATVPRRPGVLLAGDARGQARPDCFSCGHPIDDMWTEAFYSEGAERYVGWCQRCQAATDSITRCMQQLVRVYIETAIARIPKKQREAVTP